MMSGKIYLRNKTRISLNDRFTTYRKQAAASAASIRERLVSDQQASARNQRLAAQMERRPAVMAALRIKKKSVLQRVGVAGRLGQKSVNSRGRAGRGMRVARGRGLQMFGFNRQGQNRLAARGRSQSMVSARSRQGRFSNGIQGYQTKRFRGLGIKRQMRTGRGRGFGSRGRGRQAGRGRAGSFNARGFGSARRGRGATRGGRGRGRARGRGRGRGGLSNWNRGPTPSKEDLDRQLDEYMAGTKSHLDLELSTYMSEQQ